MSEVSEKLFYVRARGRVTGPFNLPALMKMLRRGGLSGVDELSENQIEWTRASEIEQLFPRRTLIGAVMNAGAASHKDSDGQVPGESQPGTDASGLFHYAQSGVMYGPVSEAALRSLAEQGTLKATDMVWAAGSKACAEARQIPFLSSAFGAATQSPNGSSAEPRRPSRLIWRFVIAFVVTIGVAAIGLGGFLGYQKWTNRLVISDVKNESMVNKGVGLVVEGARVVRQDGSSVELPVATGTCFAISPSGFYITNRHVVEDAANFQHATALIEKVRRESLTEVSGKIWMFLDQQKYDADVTYMSARYDMAILHIQQTNNPFFRLASGTADQRGAEVFALGYPGIATAPMTLDQAVLDKIRLESAHADVSLYFTKNDFAMSVTRGTFGRQYQEQVDGIVWINHDATIAHGNSGGPLIRGDGLVFGVNTAGSTNKENEKVLRSLEIGQMKQEISKYVKDVVWE